jgi:hypothetical protein
MLKNQDLKGVDKTEIQAWWDKKKKDGKPLTAAAKAKLKDQKKTKEDATHEIILGKLKELETSMKHKSDFVDIKYRKH